MPTPVGHALAGVAAGFLLAGRGGHATAPAPTWRSLASDRKLLLFAGLGILADIDFLFGVHSAYTHSIGATVVVGGIATVLGRPHGPRFALAAALAYGSHIVLDWLGSDSVPPLGIMALWPFSADYFLSDRQWFTSVCRRYRDLDCWRHNVVGVLRESVLLGPLALGVLYRVARRARTS